jgi:two-component system sensor histidine kinase VicK
MRNSAAKPTESEALLLPLVSHDIKSLTRAILGASQALSTELDGSGENSRHDIRAFVQLIGCASSNLMPLIDDLVAIGKLQADSAVINPRAVYNLRQELECARDTFSYEALAKRIELSLSVADDIPVVYCDISSLRTHVINNILSNAIRYTPVGGKIAILVGKSNDKMMGIRISDSGMGIPSTERESLFRKYLRSEKYRSATGSKRGLGLYNALRCVQAHKGTLSIVDEAGVSGATFKIEIPLFTGCIQ